MKCKTLQTLRDLCVFFPRLDDKKGRGRGGSSPKTKAEIGSGWQHIIRESPAARGNSKYCWPVAAHPLKDPENRVLPLARSGANCKTHQPSPAPNLFVSSRSLHLYLVLEMIVVNATISLPLSNYQII